MENNKENNKEDNNLIRIGELAKMAGVSTRTVKYYEELGFISPADRSKGGFRYYEKEDLDRVKIIKQLQSMDYPLSKIKEFFSIRGNSETGNEAASQVLNNMEEQIEELEMKIKQYKELKEELEKAKVIVTNCLGCSNKPEKEKCTNCSVITRNEVLPLPIKVIL